MLDLYFDPTNVTAKKLNELMDKGAIRSDADYLEYRLMFNIFNGNKAIDVHDADTVLTTIRAKKQKAWIETLLMIQAVQNYEVQHQSVVHTLLNNVLKMKFDLKQTYFVCQYFIEWGYTAEPYILLSKFARRPGQFPKLYKQYIKLGYFLRQFDNKKEWKKIKVALTNLEEADPHEFCDLFKWYQMGVRSLQKEEIATKFCELCRKG